MFLFILFTSFLKGPANEDFLSYMMQPCSEVRKKKKFAFILWNSSLICGSVIQQNRVGPKGPYSCWLWRNSWLRVSWSTLQGRNSTDIWNSSVHTSSILGSECPGQLPCHFMPTALLWSGIGSSPELTPPIHIHCQTHMCSDFGGQRLNAISCLVCVMVCSGWMVQLYGDVLE